MKSVRPRTLLSAVAAVGLVAAAPAAAVEPTVPPGNSAVNQYTEAFPTARGDKDAHDRDEKNRSPKKVIGKRNAQKLEQRGSDGEAVAELTAETAPERVTVEEIVVGEDGGEGAAAPPASGGRGGGAGAGGGGPGGAPTGSEPGSPNTFVSQDIPDGSSGFSEVLARATGSSSGGMGIFLPLILLATIGWAFAYLARRRLPAS